LTNSLIDYYDGDTWDEEILTRDGLFDREKKSLNLIKKLPIRSGKFIDVGCGIGYFINALQAVDTRFECFGVDYSKYNLRKAKSTGAKLKKCNLEEGIPYEDNTFDLVYAAELIEHIANTDLVASEFNRILKKGGYVIITTPNLCAWFNRLLILLGIQPIFYESSTVDPNNGAGIIKRFKKGTIPVGHIRIFTKRALTDLLESNGFEIIAVKGTHFSSLPKWIRWIDNIFMIYPRLSAGLIVLAKKIKA
jgi:ubiquinone/menaquinone biosynthesis C-methylase UbiE